MKAKPTPTQALRQALAALAEANPEGLPRVRARVDAADASGALLAGVLDMPAAREEALLWLLNEELQPARPLTSQEVACHKVTWTRGELDGRFVLADMERPAARMDPGLDIDAADVWKWLRARAPRHPTLRTLPPVLLRNAASAAPSPHADTTLAASRRRPSSTLWVKAGRLVEATTPGATGVALDTSRRITRFMECATDAGIFVAKGAARGRLAAAAPQGAVLHWPPTLTSLGLAARPHTCLGVFLPRQAWPVLAIAIPSAEVEDCLARPLEESLAAQAAAARPRRGKPRRITKAASAASAPSAQDERRLRLTLDDLVQGDANARIIHWDAARVAAAAMQVAPSVRDLLQEADAS